MLFLGVQLVPDTNHRTDRLVTDISYPPLAWSCAPARRPKQVSARLAGSALTTAAIWSELGLREIPNDEALTILVDVGFLTTKDRFISLQAAATDPVCTGYV